MSRYRNLTEVLEAWERCDLPRGEIPIAVAELLDESNVDEVIEALPEPHRGDLLDWAEQMLATPPEQWRLVRLGTSTAPLDPEPFPRREEVYAALRSWLDRHPRAG